MKIDKQLLKEIIEYNGDINYDLSKLAEESSELTTVLLQSLLKPHKVKEQEVIDELGDVLIRIKLLIMQNGLKEKVQARIDSKLSRYQQYIENKSYDKI